MAFRQKMQAVMRYLQFLWESLLEGQFFSYFQATLRYLMKGVGGALFLLRKEREQVGLAHNPSMQKLRRVTEGLHRLLGDDKAFSYAIFLPWIASSEKELQISLDAAFSQTAPHLQVWVGKPERCTPQVELLFTQYKERGLRVFQVEEGQGAGEQLNAWAAVVEELFLLVLLPGCWLRTDCLFRVEQYLRLFPLEKRSHQVLFF